MCMVVSPNRGPQHRLNNIVPLSSLCVGSGFVAPGSCGTFAAAPRPKLFEAATRRNYVSHS